MTNEISTKNLSLNLFYSEIYTLIIVKTRYVARRLKNLPDCKYFSKDLSHSQQTRSQMEVRNINVFIWKNNFEKSLIFLLQKCRRNSWKIQLLSNILNWNKQNLQDKFKVLNYLKNPKKNLLYVFHVKAVRKEKFIM